MQYFNKNTSKCKQKLLLSLIQKKQGFLLAF